MNQNPISRRLTAGDYFLFSLESAASRLTAATLLLLATGAALLGGEPQRSFHAGPAPDDLPPWSVTFTIPDEPVATLWPRDHEALDAKILQRIAAAMEAARDDEADERCSRHLAAAVALANRYPSLIAPWREIWRCTPDDDPRHEALRLWLSTLLDHAERGGLEKARWPEQGVEVHSLIDALSVVELRGESVLDAWYLTFANGQKLRIGVRLWNPDVAQESTRYFIPLSEIRAGREMFTDPNCRIRAAECIIENIPSTGYTVARINASALLARERGQKQEAVKKIYDIRNSSLFAAVTAAEWLLVDYNWTDIAKTMSDILTTALGHDSAEAKAMKSMLLAEEYLPPATDGEMQALQEAAVAELGRGTALELEARYLEMLDPASPALALRFKAAAEAGSTAAERRLAAYDAPHASEWLVRAAHGGEREAMFELGERFYDGRQVEQDNAKALYWWRRAAALGHPSAMLNLAELLLAGDATLTGNRNEAQAWLRHSADLGEPRAQRRMAELAAGGCLALTLDEQENWLRRAADQGEAVAQRLLAEWLWQGRTPRSILTPPAPGSKRCGKTAIQKPRPALATGI